MTPPGARLRRGPRRVEDGCRRRRRTAVQDRRRRAAGRRRRRRRRTDPPVAVVFLALGATKLWVTVGFPRLRARPLGVAVLLHVVDFAVTRIRLAFADGLFDGSTRRTRACSAVTSSTSSSSSSDTCSWSRTTSSRTGRVRRRREFSPTGRWRRGRRCRAPRDSPLCCGDRRRATGGTALPARRRSGR